jgi:ABC-type uncharacterized transport system involved in gliding motility auxiliary subunit
MREKYRPIFDQYKDLSPKFKLEVVDPNKEPIRAKQMGIKKMETLVLNYQGRITKIEEISEEKITNELIKLTRDKRQNICSVVGHGEQSFTNAAAEGLSSVKKGLEDQSYDNREITLAQELKIPADCSAVVMMGPVKALFPSEIKALGEYLDQGGRLVLGLEASIAQGDQTAELRNLLKTWSVDVKGGLIIDPVSKMLGVDASVPIIAQYNNEQAITKDFKQQAYLPFSRPVDPANPAVEGLTSTWIAKTTPKAWGEMNMASLAKGEVQLDIGSDIQGPLNVAVAVSGKRKAAATPATKETRLVVFGSAQFASNQYSRFGANIDLFLNAVSWALEDENLISIRTKKTKQEKLNFHRTKGLRFFGSAWC